MTDTKTKYPRWDDRTEVDTMNGLTLTRVVGMEQGSDQVLFYSTCGREFVMWHDQDCCEHVELVEVVGDPDVLVGETLLDVRVDSNADGPPPEYPESWTWTFYTFRTNRGTVTLRWLGESNGYYSEEVDFGEVSDD